MRHVWTGLLCWILSAPVAADIHVTDDAGNTLNLAAPAQRIVALSPHVAELLFAIGAGEQLVATVAFSDYPAAAKAIPRLGDASRIDMERLVVLQPDLVVGWASGNSQDILARIKQLAIPLYLTDDADLGAIADDLEDLGRLTGHAIEARQLAQAFRQQLRDLRQRYSNNQRVRVFYQVWQQPLMTFSSRHVVDQVIRLCGGENIFAALPGLTPQVSTEAVIASDPDVIIAADFDDGSRVHDFWQRWRQLRAVRNGHVYVIHPDILHRSTPRILQGAAQLCDYLESVRSTQP